MLILAGALASAQYTPTRIALDGSSGGNECYQINALGQVSGMNGATNTAFIWTPNGGAGTLKSLLYKAFPSEVNGLNRYGDAVGTAYGNMPTAVLWPFSGTPYQVDKSGTQQNGESINDNGDVALYYRSRQYHGIEVSRLANGKRTTYKIGGMWPRRINNGCQVLDRYGSNGLGVSLFTPNAAKTSWTSRDTGLGFGRDLNDSGAAVGDIYVPLPPPIENAAWSYPAVYVPSAMYGLPAGMTDLFAEVTSAVGPPSYVLAWRQGAANAINNSGVIVGSVWADYNNGNSTESRAWIRTPFAGTLELSVDGYTNLSPHDINDSGQIVATATGSDGLSYCLLLTPFL